MKKSMIILTVTALAAGFAFTGNADAGVRKTTVVTHKHVTKRDFGRDRVVHKDVTKVVKVKQVNRGYEPWRGYGYRRPYGTVSAFGTIGGFSFAIGAPVICPPPAPVFVVEQIWVEPITETRLVGYDAFGRPIYQEVVLTPGAYRNAQYQVLADGSREFVTYLP